MTETQSQFLNLRKSALQRKWARFLQWARRIRLRTKLEIFFAIISLFLGTATAYVFYQSAGQINLENNAFDTLLPISAGVLLIFVALVGHRIFALFKAGGGQLQGKIITFSGLMAVIPVVVLAIFSGLIFERGMVSWFSDRVRSTLNNSLQVAEGYITEHRRTIQGDLLAMANDINRKGGVIMQDPRLLQILVEDQMTKRALSEAFVFDGDGNVIAMARFNIGAPAEGFEKSWLDRANEGEVVIVSSTSDDRVRAIVKLNFFMDTYLFVSRFVDPTVLGHLQAARDSLAEYERLEAERSGIQFNYEATFFIIALLLLMGAVWIGFLLSGQLTDPIRKLAGAAEKVGKGDFKTRLPANASSDEIGVLSRAFNKMTRQLETQQKDLKKTNRQLDERRRFSEAVLAGVSAGVIGLDKRCNITLPNRSACDFLGMTREQLEGKRMLNVIPELKPLLTRVLGNSEETAQGQVSITRGGKGRTLLVRIAAESGKAGYVITFDDITDQLADQRTAAWADVARRIAHEIKNPLTPIQLAAERLKRKYGNQLVKDKEVFDQCTDTIIRQVGDLRRMVDEFSSFARLPKPIFREENLTSIIRQAVFLQEVSAPAINFKFKSPAKPPRLYCDSRQIAQAMTNLLKNAVESILDQPRNKAKQAGEVQIELKTGRDTLQVIVTDTGPGLPEGMIERLLEPYVTTRSKGTGLGLAIVRKIMEDHYGSIRLENRKDKKGARITLNFDLKALSKKAKNLSEEQQPGSAEIIALNRKSKVGSYGA